MTSVVPRAFGLMKGGMEKEEEERLSTRGARAGSKRDIGLAREDPTLLTALPACLGFAPCLVEQTFPPECRLSYISIMLLANPAPEYAWFGQPFLAEPIPVVARASRMNIYLDSLSSLIPRVAHSHTVSLDVCRIRRTCVNRRSKRGLCQGQRWKVRGSFDNRFFLNSTNLSLDLRTVVCEPSD